MPVRIVTALWLAGCAAQVPADAPPPVRLSADPPPMTRPAIEIRSGRVQAAPGQGVGIEALTAAVREDAARLLGLADGAALDLHVETVTWSDGSIGCPQPGLMYTQALVPGWRIVVMSGGRELRYHASRGGQWLLCPAGRAHEPLPGSAIR